MNVEHLVLSKQKSVESLLIEVRDEYARAMKSAIIDYKRRDHNEHEKYVNMMNMDVL